MSASDRHTDREKEATVSWAGWGGGRLRHYDLSWLPHTNGKSQLRPRRARGQDGLRQASHPSHRSKEKRMTDCCLKVWKLLELGQV